MEGVTAGTDTEAAPIFREVGASWYWVLAGPISAAVMLWIEKSNGNGWQLTVPVFFLVRCRVSLGCKSKRRASTPRWC